MKATLFISVAFFYRGF